MAQPIVNINNYIIFKLEIRKSTEKTFTTTTMDSFTKSTIPNFSSAVVVYTHFRDGLKCPITSQHAQNSTNVSNRRFEFIPNDEIPLWMSIRIGLKVLLITCHNATIKKNHHQTQTSIGRIFIGHD